MKHLFLLKWMLYGVLFFSSVDLYAFQAQLIPLNNKKIEIVIGSFFTGIIRVWPFENSDHRAIEKFKLDLERSLNGRKFLDYFYVSNVVKIVQSENNHDVYDVHAVLVLYKELKDNSFYVWKFNKQKIPVIIKGIEAVKLDFVPEEFLVANEYEVKTDRFIVIFLGVFIFIGISFFIIRAHSLNLKRRVKREEKQIIDDCFFYLTTVKNREGYERAYKEILEWGALISEGERVVGRFKKRMDEIQYKEKWSDFECNDIEQLFQKIVEEYKDKYGIQ